MIRSLLSEHADQGPKICISDHRYIDINAIEKNMKKTLGGDFHDFHDDS
jgi:hypothetical protein